MLEPSVIALIDGDDINGLLRVVDGLCEGRRWDDLLDLADRCEDATERGKQLWPIAAHIDYRIALEASPEFAGGVLIPESGRFSLGPLTEVAASTHTWDELAPYIDTPQVAAYVAQERVLRGEDLTGDDAAHPELLGLPLHLEEWEPVYPLATYTASEVEVAEPWAAQAPVTETSPARADEVSEGEITDALLDLVQPWVAESNGAARSVVVDGTASGAAGLLSVGGLRMGQIEPADVLQLLAWAAASGGAYGRRRGAAFGRSTAWYTAALLSSLDPPAHPDELIGAMSEMRWFRWDEGAPEKGWVLRIAVEDPDEGWAAAIAATDLIEEDED
ncbi:MAG TPA: DUF6183 family protein [Actinomycetota bacterium]|nr:DUF6183 family protein [Actinomycetota bacterium]